MILRLIVALMCLFSSFAYSALFKSENTALLGQWLSGIHRTTNDVIQGRKVHIGLQVLPIWQDSIDGEWLYIESRIIGSSNKPFRQRILQLVASPNGFIRLYSYSIPRASDFAGAYYFPEVLQSLTQSQLSINNNCELLIELKVTGTFVGETDSDSCMTNTGIPLMTTFFAVSEVNISFLDGAYDKFGNLMPGQLDKPVTFLKLEDYHVGQSAN
ncbi:MAG: chromophore lyase CpcT/CpeT [Moritella sp.]|uniref:chromophore lyase CpcT/CpeT n=1 Tax=Moritella sp. TaxID=78556 RepID=UPI0029A13033|nr:chromophore lyase CpcT/CpeT [Moritella sp.]MDX2320656.1 chromophore lyase CpcT/CpeT [Moritella sp.]